MDFGKLLLKLVGVAKDSIEDSNNDSRPKQQSRPSQSYTPPAVEKSVSEWEAYFKEILVSEFSSYNIREHVPVPDLVGFVTDEFKDYVEICGITGFRFKEVFDFDDPDKEYPLI